MGVDFQSSWIVYEPRSAMQIQAGLTGLMTQSKITPMSLVAASEAVAANLSDTTEIKETCQKIQTALGTISANVRSELDALEKAVSEIIKTGHFPVDFNRICNNTTEKITLQ